MMQRSDELTEAFAVPTATDARFKAAAFCLLMCWLTTGVSLWHSIHHYEARNRGFINRMVGGIGYMPFRFALMMPLALAVIAYQALCAWRFDLSPLKVGTNLMAMYVGGYLPSLLILAVQCISGFTRANEDKALIQQRRQRGHALDQELGIVQKPAWWRRVNGEFPAGSMRDRLMRNVREIGGGRPTASNLERAVENRSREAEAAAATDAQPGTRNIEMNSLSRSNSLAGSIRSNGSRPPPPYTQYSARSDRRRHEQTVQGVAGLLFPNASPQTEAPNGLSVAGGNGRGRTAQPPSQVGPGTSERSNSTASGATLNAPPQQIRSMLDV